jgi:hypothetical protein
MLQTANMVSKLAHQQQQVQQESSRTDSSGSSKH